MNRKQIEAIALQLIGLAIIIYGILWVSNEDYKNSIRDVEEYCQKVESGKWPAYNGSEACKK